MASRCCRTNALALTSASSSSLRACIKVTRNIFFQIKKWLINNCLNHLPVIPVANEPAANPVVFCQQWRPGVPSGVKWIAASRFDFRRPVSHCRSSIASWGQSAAAESALRHVSAPPLLPPISGVCSLPLPAGRSFASIAPPAVWILPANVGWLRFPNPSDQLIYKI